MPVPMPNTIFLVHRSSANCDTMLSTVLNMTALALCTFAMRSGICLFAVFLFFLFAATSATRSWCKDESSTFESTYWRLGHCRCLCIVPLLWFPRPHFLLTLARVPWATSKCRAFAYWHLYLHLHLHLHLHFHVHVHVHVHLHLHLPLQLHWSVGIVFALVWQQSWHL